MKETTEYEDEVFFVFNPRRGKPQIRHKTFDEAKRIAQQHAIAEPGEKFFVLKTMVSYKIPLDPMVFKVYKPAAPIYSNCPGYEPIVNLLRKQPGWWGSKPVGRRR